MLQIYRGNRIVNLLLSVGVIHRFIAQGKLTPCNIAVLLHESEILISSLMYHADFTHV